MSELFYEDRLFCVNYLCLQKGNVFYTTTPVYKYYERSSSAISTLKKEFNYKFLTDFDSYIQIMHLVSIYGLLQDAKIIKFSFISSYMRIQNMMKYQWYSGFKIKVSYEKCFIPVCFFYRFAVVLFSDVWKTTCKKVRNE